jgi:hypothetical protein
MYLTQLEVIIAVCTFCVLVLCLIIASLRLMEMDQHLQRAQAELEKISSLKFAGASVAPGSSAESQAGGRREAIWSDARQRGERRSHMQP